MASDSEREGSELEFIGGHFTDLYRASKKPPSWVIEGLLPSGLTILIGPPKDGYKSTIAMACANLVAGFQCRALPQEWVPKQTGPVMIFSYEADAGELRTMAEDGLGVVGRADESIVVADDPASFRLDDPEAAEQMQGWLEERGPALVILDPLANFHQLEEKDATKMIGILSPLRRWAKAHDSAFLVVHHPRKLNEDRAYRPDDARGTSAVFGLCDGIICITPGRQKLELLLDARFKRSQPWTKTIRLGAWENRGNGSQPLTEVQKLVVAGIQHGYRTREKLAKHTGLAAHVVEKKLRILQASGVVHEEAGRFKLNGKAPQ